VQYLISSNIPKLFILILLPVSKTFVIIRMTILKTYDAFSLLISYSFIVLAPKTIKLLIFQKF